LATILNHPSGVVGSEGVVVRCCWRRNGFAMVRAI